MKMYKDLLTGALTDCCCTTLRACPAALACMVSCCKPAIVLQAATLSEEATTVASAHSRQLLRSGSRKGERNKDSKPERLVLYMLTNGM